MVRQEDRSVKLSKFRGFPPPPVPEGHDPSVSGIVLIPTVLEDVIADYLTFSEYKVMLSIAARTSGRGYRMAAIPIDVLEAQTGVTRRTVRKALKALIELNLVVAEDVPHEPTRYGLRIEAEQ